MLLNINSHHVWSSLIVLCYFYFNTTYTILIKCKGNFWNSPQTVIRAKTLAKDIKYFREYCINWMLNKKKYGKCWMKWKLGKSLVFLETNSTILLTGYHSKLIKRKNNSYKNEWTHKMKLTRINYKKSLFLDWISRLVKKVWRELWNPKGIGNPVIDF